MKFSFAILLSTVSSVVARTRSMSIARDGLRADSELGMKILSQARRVQEEGDAAVDYTWVSGYSLKFQGCHNTQQWNDQYDEENDVRVITKRLIRFRLCPTSSCSASKADGCSQGYGSYIVDLNTFMNAYFEVTRKISESDCQTYLANNCDCSNENGNDNGNAEYCQYDCLAAAGLESCADKNPYADGAEVEQFNPEDYMECTQFQYQGNGEANNADAENANVVYFIGPYCSSDGRSVHLGLFTEESCTSYAGSNGGSSEFAALTGEKLPYSAVSLIQPTCLSCVDTDNNNDADQNTQVMDACENIYTSSGKCESNLPSGTASEPNLSGCNYMEGIKAVRNDGVVRSTKSRKNGVATFFIILFLVVAAGLAFYINILRKKLATKQDPLLES